MRGAGANNDAVVTLRFDFDSTTVLQPFDCH